MGRGGGGRDWKSNESECRELSRDRRRCEDSGAMEEGRVRSATRQDGLPPSRHSSARAARLRGPRAGGSALSFSRGSVGGREEGIKL